MALSEIIEIVTKRLDFLRSQRTSAVSVGDLNQVARLDTEITETSATLDRLRSLV